MTKNAVSSTPPVATTTCHGRAGGWSGLSLYLNVGQVFGCSHVTICFKL